MKNLLHLLLPVALLAPAVCLGQKSITLYGQVIRASEILPNGKEFGPQVRIEDAGRTVLLATRGTQSIVATSLNQYLGSIYSTTNLSAEPKPFLNLENGSPQPILDNINFDFYATTGFYKLEHEGKTATLPSYEDFKAAFNGAKTLDEKRVVLIKYRGFADSLANTRYAKYNAGSGIKFTARTNIAKAFKTGLGADITSALLKSELKFNGNLRASIDNAVTRSVTMTGGRYHEIKLDPEYVRKASQTLSPYTQKLNTIPANTAFGEELIEFLPSTSEAVVVGAAVLEGSFDITRTQDLKTAVAAAVQASLQNPAAADAVELAVTVNASIEHSIHRQLDLSTGHSFFYIRLLYSRALELQAVATASEK